VSRVLALHSFLYPLAEWTIHCLTPLISTENVVSDPNDFFDIHRHQRSCRKSTEGNKELVRISPAAYTSLHKIFTVTKISKRKLLSYAVYLLDREFTKWISGDQSAEFGYQEDEVENG